MTDAPESYEIDVSFTITEELNRVEREQWVQTYRSHDHAVGDLRESAYNLLPCDDRLTGVENVTIDVDIDYRDYEGDSE